MFFWSEVCVPSSLKSYGGVLLTLPLALVRYLFHPKFFDINDIWIIFAAFLVMHTLFILFGLLYASARYRKHPQK